MEGPLPRFLTENALGKDLLFSKAFVGRECPNCAMHKATACYASLVAVFLKEGPVAAKQLLCGMLQTMLLCCVAECSTPDKQPTMLSHEAFARAQVFINETARPLERTLFAFYFTHGHGRGHASGPRCTVLNSSATHE